MLKTVVYDGDSGHYKLKVYDEGAIGVVEHRHPPLDEKLQALPFRQYMTDDGATSGSNDMSVNGSSTNVDFYVTAVADYDIYLKSISVVIGDGGAPNLNGFGALAALTNGIQWCFFGSEIGLYELHDGIKTNLEFIRLGVDTAGIGTGTDAFLADVSGDGSEKSYLPTIDIEETFGLRYGLRLRKGTQDKLVFTVRDDLSALTTFNAISYGIRL
jgi:hypothetical protein